METLVAKEELPRVDKVDFWHKFPVLLELNGIQIQSWDPNDRIDSTPCPADGSRLKIVEASK
jgi:hypothetical protein